MVEEDDDGRTPDDSNGNTSVCNELLNKNSDILNFNVLYTNCGSLKNKLNELKVASNHICKLLLRLFFLLVT